MVCAGLLAGCRDDNAKSHVYQAPRPIPAPVATTRAPVTPELPIGLMGPEARIRSVTDAEHGNPVSLSGITGAFSVLTIVALGPHDWQPDRRARIAFVIKGPTDTTLVLPLAPPASVITAHAFVVPVARAGGIGLRSGNYSAQVRLIMRGDATHAESTPIYFVVAR